LPAFTSATNEVQWMSLLFGSQVLVIMSCRLVQFDVNTFLRLQ